MCWHSQKGHAGVVRMLLDSSKVDGNKATHDGLTPLLVAVSMGHADVARALIESVEKVDGDKASGEGETPLYLARYGSKHGSCCDLLVIITNTSQLRARLHSTWQGPAHIRRIQTLHYTVMTYIVMAYIVMAYIVMAYIGMPYKVIAYIVMSYIAIGDIGMVYMVMASVVVGYM